MAGRREQPTEEPPGEAIPRTHHGCSRSLLTELVKGWIAHSFFCRVLPVEQSQGEGLGESEDGVVHQHHVRVEEGGARPHVVGGKPHLDEEHGNVLVEAVHEHLRDPGIVPSTVDEEKPLKEAELGDGKVGAVGGLQSFVARYTHTDSCGLEDTNLSSCVFFWFWIQWVNGVDVSGKKRE